MTNEPGSDRRRFLKATGASALAAAVAGCNLGGITDQKYEAKPYALGPEGRKPLGFEAVDARKVSETRKGETLGVEGKVTVVSHTFSYGLEAQLPASSAWRVPSSESWSAGVLSTPTITVGGEAKNPLATKPLGELLAGDTGSQFRQAMSLEGEQSWDCGPERVGTVQGSMLGQSTRFEAFAGILATEGGGKVGVAVYVGRVETDGDAVIAGAVDRRPVGGDARPGSNCLTPHPDPDGGVSEAEAVDVAEAAVAERLERIRKMAELVREAKDEDRESVQIPPSTSPNISNVRLVQEVEDSALTTSSQSVSDPPIVVDQPTAVLFDLDPKNVGQLEKGGVKVWIEVEQRGNRYPIVRDFWIRPQALRGIAGGDSVAATFHEMARSADPKANPPVFSGDPKKVRVKITEKVPFGGHGTHNTLETASTTVSNTKSLNRTLKVGFIEVADPKQTTGQTWQGTTTSYGSANGRAVNFVRSVNSSYELLRRAYPGEVVAYRHDTSIAGLRMTHIDNQNQTDIDQGNVWGNDFTRARTTLNTVAQQTNFPTGGELYHSTVDASTAESMIRSSGFDVTVAILPRGTAPGNNDYFGAHRVRASGKFIGRKKAVGALEALAPPGYPNDLGHASITAQEIGHFFTGNPYQDSQGNPFCRTYTDNQGVRRDDIGHASSNLESVGYSLVDGRFTLVNDPEISDGSFDPGSTVSRGGNLVNPTHTSFMSYTGGSRWTDSRITDYLVRSGFANWYWNSNPDLARAAGVALGVASGGGDDGDGRTGGQQVGEGVQQGEADIRQAEEGVQPVIEAFGRVEDGVVLLDRSWAYDGNPVDTEAVDVQRRLAVNDADPVPVALVGPEGEPIRETVVPDRLTGTHGDETLNSVAVSLPFEQGGVWLDAEYDGRTTRLNAVVHPLEHAVRRVPDEGFPDGADGRGTLLAVLDDADEKMRDEQYDKARSLLVDDFTAAVQEYVAGYEALADEPTAEELLTLAEGQAARLANL